MTRLPLEDRSVTGTDGPDYDLNVVCAMPVCGLQGTETHHVWRRSFLSGDYQWVVLPDGTSVGNLVRLCNQHHHMVTINAAWIVWQDGQYLWHDLIAFGTDPLSFQPPRLAERPGVDVLGDLDREVDQPDPDDETDDSSGVSPLGGHGETLPVSSPDHTHYWNEDTLRSPAEVAADGTCPTCMRPLARKQEKKEVKRERRTWSITVPRDAREDGAETLDNQLEEARQAMARAGLPYGDESSVKFFVLSQALGLFVMHADDVLS